MFGNRNTACKVNCFDMPAVPILEHSGTDEATDRFDRYKVSEEIFLLLVSSIRYTIEPTQITTNIAILNR